MPGSSVYFWWKAIISISNDATSINPPTIDAQTTNPVLSASRALSIRDGSVSVPAVARHVTWTGHKPRTGTPSPKRVPRGASFASIPDVIAVADAAERVLVRHDLGPCGAYHAVPVDTARRARTFEPVWGVLARIIQACAASGSQRKTQARAATQPYESLELTAQRSRRARTPSYLHRQRTRA